MTFMWWRRRSSSFGNSNVRARHREGYRTMHKYNPKR
jgi:hypothetical protein